MFLKSTLLHLWDQILLTEESTFHYFIDIEILRYNKEDILKRSQEELPQFLVNLIIEDRDYARRLLKEAQKTSSNTPISFHEMLTKCTQEQIVVDSVDYVRMEKLPCLSVEPKEIIGHFYAEQLLFNLRNNVEIEVNGTHSAESTPNENGKKFKFAIKRNKHNKTSPPLPPPPPPQSVGALSTSSSTNESEHDRESTNKRYSRKVRKSLKQSTKYAQLNRNLKYFILDCRSLQEYEAGHLPTAFWINPKMEVSSEQLREKLSSLLSMKGCHFVLFFDGRHTSTDRLLLNQNDPLSILQTDVYAQHEMYTPQPEEYQDAQQLFRQSLSGNHL